MSIEIRVLGRFEVLADGERCPADPWRRRHAAALVKLLALAPRRTLHREQLIDVLWPDVPVADAAPRLHKAAHFARHALPFPDRALQLRGDTVSLLPDDDVRVDALEFEAAATAAVADGSAAAAERALASYGGELLPEDRYEPWAEQHRTRLDSLRLQLLRQAGGWDAVLELDPADEEAHVALMRGYAEAGDRTSVLRQFERMDRALRHELGIAPGPDASALRDQALAGLASAQVPQQRRSREPLLVGRDALLDQLRRAFDVVDSDGAGRTLLLSGAPGAGKTTLLRWLREEARRRGWRVGAGAAATIEGAWPYAPVLEAVADLCRADPGLLDGLDDHFRDQLDAALAVRTPAVDDGVGQQRLFVAAGALLDRASAASGLLVLVDDVHDADDASLRLLHYLSRGAHRTRLVVVVAHRVGEVGSALEELTSSLTRRPDTLSLALEPLDADSCAALARSVAPELDDDAVERVCELAGGLPFAITELARAAAESARSGQTGSGMTAGLALTARLAPVTRDLLARIAVAGTAFDTDEFVALSGLPDELAYARLQSALAGRVLERFDRGYRFRHALLREDLLAALPPERRAALHRDAAERLARLGASPARVGHHLVAAGSAAEAVPHLLAAARTETALGAYRDALALLDQVRGHASGKMRAEVAVLRGDLLAALGDRGAVEAYREAVRSSSDELRRRARLGLARAATFTGDMATATEALRGLEPNGGPNDTALLLARGNLAYFSGDLDAAWRVAEQARDLVSTGAEGWQVLDLVALQGLLAHNRGEWFERLTLELQQGRHAPQVAAAVFDSHLCVAEYLLYGPTPYARVIDLARTLRATAEQAGVLRGVAFATALLGEAALLSGDLELAAEQLAEAVELHRDIAARAGEAHCLQRLSEVHLARGDRAVARLLCEQALPLARWSAIAGHLVQRIFGTLIAAADDPGQARDLVHRAEAAIGGSDSCIFCAVMLAVPSAIACADAGDLDGSRGYLEVGERSAQLWEGTAWQAALDEAAAHLALAEDDPVEARRLLDRAHAVFTATGQPLDAARCSAYADRLSSLTAEAAMP